MRNIQISKPAIGREEIDAVVGVLKTGNLSQGPLVKELEERFANFCGSRYAIALNNGTATLHTALHALGVGRDDEVVTTPFTFVATANAILMQGAKPVFCDIEEKTFNIDPAQLESHISKKTRAIMPVDLFGHIYDVEAIGRIARQHLLPIVEDAAQSVAASYRGKKAGNVAEIASFSLYATKNMTAGVGGLLTTDDEKVMKKCKLFRHHGQDESAVYDYKEFGYNYRMLDMTAAIALEQLKKIEGLTEKRRLNAKYLNEGLRDIEGIILPVEREGYRHVYHQYTIRIAKDYKLSRDAFIACLGAKGIQCKIYYPKPLHLFPHLMTYGYKKGDFPVAERLAGEVVSLPVHPLVTKEEIQWIVDCVRSI
jgi:perosamine synthetase